jgi:hypothetical protein
MEESKREFINAFSGGYLKEMVLDKGCNQPDFLIGDNVGSIQTLFPNFNS